MNFPSHIALIPDGNRRFAKDNNMPLEMAYIKGFEKTNQVAEWLSKTPVKATTFWALSLDNFTKRGEIELKILFKIMKSYLEKTINSREFQDNNVKVNFFGRKEMLPLDIRLLTDKLEKNTFENNGREVNFAIAYSGQDEIVHAAKFIAKDLKEEKITEDDIEKNLSNYLYYPKQVDLVIRTGNVQRLSGFLPIQSGYSELYFSPKMWPAFEQKDLTKALEFYGGIERRFGK